MGRRSVLCCLLVAVVAWAGVRPTDAAVACFNLTALGTTSPTPTANKGGCASLLTVGTTDNNCSEVRIVIDLGRSALEKLATANVRAAQINAVLLTHAHMDHTASIPDMLQQFGGPLRIVMPNDNTTLLVAAAQTMSNLDWFQRLKIMNLPQPVAVPITFELDGSIQTVLTLPVPSGGNVVVEAVVADHGSDRGVTAGQFRVTTPAGIITFSGDQTLDRPTILGTLSANANVMHVNPFYGMADQPGIPPVFATIHMNSTKTGSLAEGARAPVLFATHLVPPVGSASFQQSGTPATIRMCDRNPKDGVPEVCPQTADDYELSFRTGGYTRDIAVAARDLYSYVEAKLDIAQLVLIDANTGADLAVLADSSPIDLAALSSTYGTHRFSIRADLGANAASVERVTFSVLTAAAGAIGEAEFVAVRTDSTAPYTISVGHWNGWPQTATKFTIRAQAAFTKPANAVQGPLEFTGSPKIHTFVLSPDSHLAGCSDGTREGFSSRTAYPFVAACSGAWTAPGVQITQNLVPLCNRAAGNAGGSISSGCSAADLCEEGWHVCESPQDVVTSSGSDGCISADLPSGSFFATRTSGSGNGDCDTATHWANDVFGCGSGGSALLSGSEGCTGLNSFSHSQCSGLSSNWNCADTTNGWSEASELTHSSSTDGGVLCCRDTSPPSSSHTTGPVCEGATVRLSCPSGSVIAVASATYGRSAVSVCPWYGYNDNTACALAAADAPVAAACQGLQVCSFLADEAFFGSDPCVGTFKYATVTYTCQ